jgi:DNA primase
VIPPSFVQDLLARADIVELIGRHVQLKKTGANRVGLCPFHGEKTPSFAVNAARQNYHCFGCGVHGNAIGFLMEFTGLGFIEAVQDLAQQVGMVVPQDTRSPQERAQAVSAKAHKNTLSETLEKANVYYQNQLQTSPHAVAYLQKRGLTEDITKQFGLGYCAKGWRNLATIFKSYDDPLLEDCGLVISPADKQDSDNKRYDRFRDRIMFPIRSVQGEVIGFGGRVLDASEPKYLNSPETSIFIKGRELYGLHEARAGLRKLGYALVVEGYMDVVALAQCGFPNAVATLGTACSAEHIQKLFRFTDAVVFSFDGDAAGHRAAARALQASLPHATDTRNIKFLFLPNAHDPDSYVRTFGQAAFALCIEQAIPLSRQLIALAGEGCDLQTAEGRAKLLSSAKPSWSALPEGVLKMQLLTELASVGAITPQDLSTLWQSEHPGFTTPSRGTNKHHLLHHQGVHPSAYKTRLRSAPMSPADSALRMLLLHSTWWELLAPADHELLCKLPEPHGSLCAWLERYLHEHGGVSWAVLSHILQQTEWADWVAKLVPPSAFEDAMDGTDLKRVMDGMWVKQLQAEKNQLLADVSQKKPDALAKWKEIDAQLKQRQAALVVSPLT